MAKNRRGSWRQRLANFFELPKDIVMDVPKTTIIGALQLSIENHRGILEYSPERVVIGIHTGQVSITGKELVIGTVDGDEITVLGQIESLNFEG